MRKFFRLSQSSGTIWRYVNDYNLYNFDDFPLITGDKLESKPDGVELEVSNSGRWPDLLNNPLSWLIVSRELKEIFQTITPDFCRFFSLRDHFNGTVIDAKDYWLLSFFRKINCMDRERSYFRERDGTLESIAKLVVNDHLIPLNEHVFLLEGCETYLIVDQFFKNSLFRSNIVGVTLIPIET